MDNYRSGFVTIVGKPNVGKSTLLNTLVGQKVSITSSKPQTTRHRILGVHTDSNTQIVFVDTPGLHKPEGKALNKVITRTARSSLAGVDVVVMMITYAGWRQADRFVLNVVKGVSVPVILAINKIDRIKEKERLLPLIDASSKLINFAEIIPLSAKSGLHTGELRKSVSKLLPVAPMCFPEEQVTDRDARFMVSELIREQVFRLLGEEIPYTAAVRVHTMQEAEPFQIEAHVWVDKQSHKGIVVGKKGQRIKEISTRARHSIERYLGRHVFLDLVVKVRRGWSDNQADLNSLGYTEDV